MRKIDKSRIVLILLSTILLITNVITLTLYLNEKYQFDEEAFYNECQEEIEDIRLYIRDWFADISSLGYIAEVYKNEIRFAGGTFPLTVSQNRLRAVYPKGERFFRLNHITYVEFSEENNRILCRIFYGNGGEFVFKVD